MGDGGTPFRPQGAGLPPVLPLRRAIDPGEKGMKMKKAFAICMIMALLLAAGCAKKVAEASVHQTASAAPAAPAVSAATADPAQPTGD